MDAIEWLKQLTAHLDALPSAVNVSTAKPSPEQVDAIHQALLRKQRSGSLGFK